VCAEKGFLSNLLGVGGIAEYAQGNLEDPALVFSQQNGEIGFPARDGSSGRIEALHVAAHCFWCPFTLIRHRGGGICSVELGPAANWRGV